MTDEYPYPHEHSRHAMLAVLATTLFFISTDNMHIVLHKLDKTSKWWSIYVVLLGFFYCFSSPFLGKTIQPSYSNFSRWYVAWLLIAAMYHLPSIRSMGVDVRMNLSLFFTLFLASLLALLFFHIIFLALWYFGLAAQDVGKRPEFLTIVQNSTVLSIACCVFYSHCGNQVPQHKPTLWSPYPLSRESIKWVAGAQPSAPEGWNMQHVKSQVCWKWLAPVGSAKDYPVFSKWVVYGELVCNDACVGPSDNISPVYSLWATFIGLYIANFVVERSTGWAVSHLSNDGQQRNTLTSPEFLDMVPWYSGTSADLFKTAFDLLVSVTLFLGRFDMRTMQAAMTQAQQHGNKKMVYSHLSKKKELWMDFMADTGDGGNSTYSIARLLAQPSLCVTDEHCRAYHDLPRSHLLLVGGDLAYPNPSVFSYERRLFKPFEYALQPPPWYKPEHIAVRKPELPGGVKNLENLKAPQCFAIPGNHDWFDGLDTFMRYICHRSWLGGWLLPQTKSYFALKLPHGWWIFGLDQALHGDIDIFQFKYFSEVIKTEVGENESVIIMTHEPNWLLDWYWGSSTGRNVSHLIQEHLKGRCRLRLAGDLHHYMRHSVMPETKDCCAEHLLVNGQGGAFLHPTHVFAKFQEFQGGKYEKQAAYPSMLDSRRIAWGNILKFRKKNWRFDVIGGIVYFILVFSMFPQCDLNDIFKQNDIKEILRAFAKTIGRAFIQMLGHSYVSMIGTLVLSTLAISFVPVKVSRFKRILIGSLHVISHLTSAMTLMLLLEIGIETCVRHNHLGTSGFHSLYDWYHSKEGDHFPDPTGLRGRIERWTFGLYPACVKYLMAAFDVPEVMAVTRSNICKKGIYGLPRGLTLVYYTTVFLYYWIFSCPIVSLVFGSYLYICINWFHLHFDEAYSSLRIANYKSFTRCHITPKGDLHVYTLAIDKVPKQWALDPHWEAEQACQKEVASHMREFPSKWTPVGLYRERNCNVRIIDFFKIKKKPGQVVTNSICDYGEDITIERGILNWCDEHKVSMENRPLESENLWGDEPSNSNNKPEISLMIEPRKHIFHSKEVFMEYFPALWDCLSSSYSKHITPMEHEPSLWETDVSVVLSDEPIESCISDKDVNSILSNESTEVCTSNEDVNSVFSDESREPCNIDSNSLHIENTCFMKVYKKKKLEYLSKFKT
ncbi:hypothetical protein M758_6G039400 [Ceratodon purpureus]|nr:hypothetical protein M758_6G039400 [Ceratodon purpureus]